MGGPELVPPLVVTQHSSRPVGWLPPWNAPRRPSAKILLSPPELARGQSAGSPHHCSTTPPVATLVTPLVDLRITRRQAPPLPAHHSWTRRSRDGRRCLCRCATCGLEGCQTAGDVSQSGGTTTRSTSKELAQPWARSRGKDKYCRLRVAPSWFFVQEF